MPGHVFGAQDTKTDIHKNPLSHISHGMVVR